MSATIHIARRFNGPPESGNGGYACGVIAGVIGEQVKVRLAKPVPLQRDLAVNEIGEGVWEVKAGDERIATAMRTELVAQAPAAVPYVEALGVSTRYVGFAQHAFPTCFVCGPERQTHDGLRIFPGAVPGSDSVAAPWLPDESLADASGKVRAEYLWAALDCPGYFAAVHPAPALLGELAVHIDRTVHVDQPCVVIGWRIRAEGRKHLVGTALFDEDGERCALGVATWIVLQPRESSALQSSAGA